jgi:hypothetical protein
MAISSPHAEILKGLVLPRGGTLLEIGEANWYGDVEPDFPCRDKSNLFAIAKDFYAHLFAPSRVVSVDMHGTDKAWKCDLNKPLPPLGTFDVLINHGTAEHVFNIAQVFASMHAACKVGGLMIHESPFTGWIDHGFYCLQPTLFFDVAAVNGYEIVGMYLEDLRAKSYLRLESREQVAQLTLPPNLMLFVVFRKQSAEPFRIPMQGYYDGRLSSAGERAWRELR